MLAAVQAQLAGQVEIRQAALAGIQRAALRDAMAAAWRDQVVARDLGTKVLALTAALAEDARLVDEKPLAVGSVTQWARRAGIDRGTALEKITALEGERLVAVLERGEGRRPWRITLMLDDRTLASAHEDAGGRAQQMLADGEQHLSTLTL